MVRYRWGTTGQGVLWRSSEQWNWQGYFRDNQFFFDTGTAICDEQANLAFRSKIVD